MCSKGEDVNFEFKGFGISGTVISSGFTKGPSGVTLELSGPDGLKLSTVSTEGGTFSFSSIPPGSYSLKATHSTLSFEKSSYSFQITNHNVVVDKQVMMNFYASSNF